MAQSIENRIFNRISDKKRGWVFTPSYFLDLGNRAAIDQALSRLVRSGDIRRLTRGIYDYPRKDSTFGDVPPSVDRISAALAEKDNLKIQPSGAYAANVLGLSDQVPAKVVFLTDGHSRTVQVGKWSIKLKKTTPKNMATAGRISGLVIQALRYIGQDNVDDNVINKLKRKLSDEDKKQLIKDMRYAPVWIGETFKKIMNDCCFNNKKGKS
ncbi:MAG: type IV toxin-antitoxin system AbiEi family antitoxin domain-containing protein [Candidatus Omnitrophica bacterium]|nr:type IV toxin-antitoxin system AbiEi family antitoxin domain-containing protein [Candidatus Omnitrophota bacterium]